jgi:hypothetical protein
MSAVSPPPVYVIQLMMAKGASEEEILAELSSHGITENEARDIISSWKKEKAVQKQKNGLALLVIGSIACFISCVLTIADVFPALNNFFLYGLTSMGVVVVFGGLVLVFE